VVNSSQGGGSKDTWVTYQDRPAPPVLPRPAPAGSVRHPGRSRSLRPRPQAGPGLSVTSEDVRQQQQQQQQAGDAPRC
jgi:hypothetical protein